MKNNLDLFADLESNAGRVIDDHLDNIEKRMKKLEKE